MSKLFQHYSDCFGVTVFLFLGSQEEMLKELTKAPVYFNKQSLEDLVCSIREQDAGLTCELRGEDAVARYLILMPGFDFEIDDYVTLDHEIAHAAHLALLERHIKDLANEDCFHCWLYFHDSLFRAFMTKLNKWREDEKKKEEKEKEQEEYTKMIEETASERVVSNEEESTADVELKKEIENKEKAKNKKKK
jgi:hypothetical protein